MIEGEAFFSGVRERIPLSWRKGLDDEAVEIIMVMILMVVMIMIVMVISMIAMVMVIRILIMVIIVMAMISMVIGMNLAIKMFSLTPNQRRTNGSLNRKARPIP